MLAHSAQSAGTFGRRVPACADGSAVYKERATGLSGGSYGDTGAQRQAPVGVGLECAGRITAHGNGEALLGAVKVKVPEAAPGAVL